MRRRAPVQLSLFGPVAVHVAVRGNCAACRVSLAVAGHWSRIEGCHDCPGMVKPAPPWALLTATAGELEHITSEAAA